MPIERTARESRDLQTHDQPHVAKSDLSHQTLEAQPIDHRGSRLAQILINDDNTLCGPSQRKSALAQTILACRAFGVFEDLVQGTLAHVQHRLAREMPCGDFVQCCWLN